MRPCRTTNCLCHLYSGAAADIVHAAAVQGGKQVGALKINYASLAGYHGGNNGEVVAIATTGETTRLKSRQIPGCVREESDSCSWWVCTEEQAVAAAKAIYGENLAVVAYYRWNLNGDQFPPETLFGSKEAVKGYIGEDAPPPEYSPVVPEADPTGNLVCIATNHSTKEVTVTRYKDGPGVEEMLFYMARTDQFASTRVTDWPTYCRRNGIPQ